MWNAGSIYMDIVWPYCANTVDVWVSRRYEFPRTPLVFTDIQKFLVVFCRYESPRTLVQICIFLPRRCVLIRFSRHRFLLYSSNLVDRVPWMSVDFSMQLDFAQSKTLSQHARPGSTSVLTLPQFSLLRSLLASFSPSFQGSKLSWNGWC